eukprot:m.63287 g.63287  ORF g.63287 m.63287 type:complete len:155 (-) comp7447_c0_seq1:16-480(-)
MAEPGPAPGMQPAATAAMPSTMPAAGAAPAAAAAVKRKREDGEEEEEFAGDELSQFLGLLDDFAPTIPDPVTEYYLTRSGFKTSDHRLVRMVSLATQKFIADVAQDALQHCKQRQASGSSRKAGKDKHYMLTTADLTAALKEHGVNAVKPQYYL